MSADSTRIPLRAILARALHPPVRERAFWITQLMVALWAVVHLLIDAHGVISPDWFPYGTPIDLLLIPVGYAALHYGLSGSAATTVWSILLWMPDLLMPDDRGHYHHDLVQLVVVTVVALFVGLEIERSHLERNRAEAAEAERRAAETHYHKLFAANVAPILLVDSAGRVVEHNEASRALWANPLWHNLDELLGVDPRDLPESPTVALETSGGERTFRVSMTVLSGTATPPLSQVILEDITAEHRSEVEARSWAIEVLRAQEQERRRIAREIHDDPLQQLLQLAREFEQLEHGSSPNEISAARDHLLDTVHHLREVTRGLHPAGLDQHGLVAALRGLMVDVEIENDIETTFIQEGDPLVDRPEIEVAIFRIVQEAVRNTVRHAHAEHLTVELVLTNDAVTVTITDDGCGFDGDLAPATGHLGLQSMAERAVLLGGTCEITSAPGQGTRVTATLPLETPASRPLVRHHA